MSKIYYIIRGFLISARFFNVSHWRDLNPNATYFSGVYFKDENCHGPHDWALIMPMGVVNVHRCVSYEYCGKWFADVNREMGVSYYEDIQI